MQVDQDRDRCKLEFIRRVINVLTDSRLRLTQKLDQSLALILKKISARQGSIMLLDKEHNQLLILAATKKDIIGKSQPIDRRAISGYVFESGQPLLIEDINKDPRFKPAVSRSKNYRTDSLLCVPLISQRQDVIGVINASDRLDDTSFSQSDLGLLIDFAAYLSPLVENSYLLHKLKEEREKYKSLAQELELKQKELMITYTERSELVQMVVHDFKSPISAVISNLDLLKYMGLREDQDPIVNTAMEGAEKLLEMINEFLEVAKLDQWQEGKGKLEPVALAPIVRQEVEGIDPIARVKGIDIQITNKEDVLVLGDPTLLSHLLQNLLSNAVKYTPQEGKARVFWEVQTGKRRTDRHDRIVKLCVQDNGPGVPDELKKVIFNRFTRAKSHKNIQGTGIGLFICSRIANLLGGKIWVEDVKGAQAKGSRFCVTLYALENGHAR
ncbi:GAF domain-containing sensor histidine kinase [Desulfohalobiaceae bacterium Ax17]|uniref:GAF domain-containing sensor histidine kinase n=1 Tax=Desulfovulcanus ferrireducens TaxID=2831190 RepID=UPI00207BCD40|nr:GAF domain-containing sensor histidine kinase [Desulfovulcanus ferrireducens]MBT8763686.1 GAF domain-containing sensor histidine kinase [Desulfovulcanus ferrireducens]